MGKQRISRNASDGQFFKASLSNYSTLNGFFTRRFSSLIQDNNKKGKTEVFFLGGRGMFLFIFELSYNFIHNELSQKTRFQSVPIAALCLYNIQRENLFF